jgi:hypothetical protein
MVPKSKKTLLTEKQPGFLKNMASYATSGQFADVDATKQTVPGLDTSDPASSAGRADFLLGNIKDSLRGLGFKVEDLDKQKTIAQLLPAPFGFKFQLLWPKKNEWGERGIITNVGGKDIGSNVDTRAKVKNPNANGGLILSTKLGFDVYFIDEKELNRTLGGGEGKLPPGKKGENYKRLLEEGITYKVKLSEPVALGGEETEEEEQKDVPVPEEIASGKNRNEIFRLLLKQFGGYNGEVVYGDGFNSPEQAREYSKLQRAVKAGKVDKSKLKEFREKANRDGYSMMISNLRKSYPTTFMSKLSKAFPEFNIKYTKESVDESMSLFPLLEEDNPDKYKRWSLVFSNKVIGGKNIDSLDKNIREFMATVKKWFAVPVKGPDGKKRSYNISYDEDKVNSYWNNFYGGDKVKKESKLNLYNVLFEMINEKDENTQKQVEPDYVLLKIANGGLSTIDEGKDDAEERSKGGGTSKGGFVDAVLVKAGSEFDKRSGKINGVFKLQPGFANMEKAASKKEAEVELNIEYEGDKVKSGIFKIKNNPEGINELLNSVIKNGEMKIKKSQKNPEYIILSYPSKTSVGNRINNTWQEILK